MGANGRKQYSADFKREAVALVTRQGYTLVAAARNLGINRDMLRRWKGQVTRDGTVAFPGKGASVGHRETPASAIPRFAQATNPYSACARPFSAGKDEQPIDTVWDDEPAPRPLHRLQPRDSGFDHHGGQFRDSRSRARSQSEPPSAGWTGPQQCPEKFLRARLTSGRGKNAVGGVEESRHWKRRPGVSTPHACQGLDQYRSRIVRFSTGATHPLFG